MEFEDIRIIEFPRILDSRGNLTFLQQYAPAPFEIRRVFWTYDVPGGEKRGGHAYKTQHELIIAVSGSFDVVIRKEDGDEKKFHLNRPYFGLHIPPRIWRHMENFSTNSLSLHLSSAFYDESDYVREWAELH